MDGIKKTDHALIDPPPKDDRSSDGMNLPPPPPPPPPQPQWTFEKDVLPIFNAKCVNCHSIKKKKGGLDVTTIAALQVGGDSGPAYIPGSLDKGTLWEQVSTDAMPPGKNKLSATEKDVLKAWIAKPTPAASK
jgi:mono/diheme cytochrome c family protein